MAIARLFVAIDLEPALKQALQACARELRETFPDARWVRPEAMHLTVHFLGDTPLERRADLAGALEPVTGGTAPFACDVVGLGVFPTPQRPAVVWAGVGAGGRELVELATRCREAMAAAGFPSDPRPFSAHITMGRLRQGSRTRTAAVQEAIHRWNQHAFGRLAVERLTAYASTLTPTGPLYEPLQTWALGQPSA